MEKKLSTELNEMKSPDLTCPDNCQEAIISTNDSLEIKSWNKGAERLYGLCKQEVMGRRLTDVILYAFISESLISFLSKLSSGQWQGEVMYIGKDHVVQFMRVSIHAVYDARRCVIGYVAIIREEAMEDAPHTNFKPVFDAEFRYVGLVSTETRQGWEMILHWHE